MKKQKLFTLEQAEYLCDSLEAIGWDVFEPGSANCSKCGELQQIEWDFCPNCGNDHSLVAPEVNERYRKKTISLVCHLVNDALKSE